MAANAEDLNEAKQSNTSSALLNRLSLSEAKLESLAAGLRQIAAESERCLGRVIKQTKVADLVSAEVDAVADFK